MSNNTTTFNVNVTDNGSTKKVVSDVKELSQGLEAVNRMATALGKTLKAAAGTSAVANAKRATTPKSDDLSDYRMARGAGGSTGAEGRDFAKQAQGLGGLVHVYATFAANLFAVSAAFNALKQAADTSNMIKGLDQMGAVSGVALGALSKRLMDATDGAVSLRQAMEATAQATSAGMTGTNLLKMGEIAKKASQTLGVSMPDALSRLSRGISKVEPELLDELGIFVRVDDAQRKYALSIGKTASSLTDLEKRQAFANAVLEQGFKKFSEINIDANPYDKLLSSAKNLSFYTLELINKALGPLVKLLSESPTALSAAMAGIVGLLIKMAIPSVVQWGAGLQESANKAAKAAKTMKEAFPDDFQMKMEQRFKIPDLEKQADKVARSLTPVSKALEKTSAKSLMGAITTNTEVTTESLTKANKALSKLQENIVQGTYRNKEASVERITSMKAEAEELKKIIALGELQRKIQIAHAKLGEEVDKPLKRIDPEYINQKKWEAIEARAQKSAAIANAYSNATIIGISGSWATLNNEIEKNGTKGIAKWSTLAMGGASAVAARVMQVAGAFSYIGVAVGVAIAAFSMLDEILSNNNKEIAETNKSLELLRETAKVVDGVFESIGRRDPLYYLSSEALSAKAKAIAGISDSVVDALSKLRAQEAKANWWDTAIEAIKKPFGKDTTSVVSKDLAYSISQAFRAIPDEIKNSGIREAFIAEFKVDPTNVKALAAVLETSNSKLEKGSKLLEEWKIKTGNLNSATQQLENSLTSTTDLMKQLMQSVLPTDSIAKIGIQLMNTANDMSKAFESPTAALNQLVKIAESPEKLAMFSPETARSIAKNAANIKIMATEYANAQRAASDLAQKQKEAQSLVDEANTTYIKRQAEFAPDDLMVKRAESDLNKALENLSMAKRDAIRAREAETAAFEKVQPFLKEFTDKQYEVFQRGSEFVEKSIGIGFQKAALTLAKARSELLGDTTAGIRERTELAKRDVALRISQIEITRQLILTQQESNLIAKTTNLRMQEQALNAQPPSEGRNTLLKQVGEDLKALDYVSRSFNRNTGAVSAPLDRMDIGNPQLVKRESTALRQLMESLNAQKAELGAELKGIDLKGALQERAKQIELEKDSLSVQSATINYLKEEFAVRRALSPIYTDDLATQEQKLDYIAFQIQKTEEYLAIQGKIEAADKRLREDQAAYDKNPNDETAARLDAAKRAAREINDLVQIMSDKNIKALDVLDLKDKERRRKGKEEAARFTFELVQTEEQLRQQLFENSKSQSLELANIEVASLERRMSGEKGLEDVYKDIIIDKKTGIALDTEAFELAKKMAQLNTSIASKRFELTEKINRLDAAKDTDLIDTYKRQLALEEQRIEEEKSGLLTISAAKRKQITEDAEFQKQENYRTLKDGLAEALIQGGKEGGKAFRKIITDELKKPFVVMVKALISPITSAISSALGDFSKTAVNGIANAFFPNMAGAAAGSSLGGLATGTGIGIAGGMGVNLASGMSSIAGGLTGISNSIGAGFSALSVGTSSSITAGLAQLAGTLGPIALGAYAVYKMFGSPGGGPKVEGGFSTGGLNAVADPNWARLWSTKDGVSTMGDSATAQTMAQTISTAYGQVAQQLGLLNKTLNVGVSYAKDPEGTSLTQLQVVSANYNRGQVSGGVENVGRSDQELQDAITRSISQLIISELKASELSGKIKDFIDSIDLGISTTELQAAVTTATNAQLLYKTFDAMGPSFAKLSDMSIATTKSLVEASGGIQNLTSTLSTFFDNFYSESEKLKIRTDYVKKSLTDLANNPSLSLTIDQVNKLFDSTGNARVEFRELTNNLDTSTESGLKTYEALLGLSSAFAQVTEAFSDTSVADITNKRRDMEIQLLRLTGRTMEATQLERQAELDALDASLQPLQRRIYLLTDTQDIEKRLNDATLDESQKLTLAREAELAATSDVLKPALRYVQALEDTKTAKDKLFQAYRTESSVMQGVIDKLRTSATTLREFAKSVLTGTDSLATPQERYTAAKEEFTQTLAAATAMIDESDKSAVAKRDAAVGKLTSVAQNFLTASKTFYASSDQYSSDANYVATATSGLADTLDSTASYQEQTLKTFTDQLTELGYISDSTQGSVSLLTQLLAEYHEASSRAASLATAGTLTKSTESNITKILDAYAGVGRTGMGTAPNQVDASGFSYWLDQLNTGKIAATDFENIFKTSVQEYIAANPTDAISTYISSFITPHAMGGLASGLSLVGEQGPELVDFTSPGRVYTAEQTRGMFSSANDGFMNRTMQNLVDEVQQLRSEVTKLRTEQQKQTGDIIMSNYDANAKAAETVAEAVDSASADTVFAQRTQVKIA